MQSRCHTGRSTPIRTGDSRGPSDAHQLSMVPRIGHVISSRPTSPLPMWSTRMSHCMCSPRMSLGFLRQAPKISDPASRFPCLERGPEAPSRTPATASTQPARSEIRRSQDLEPRRCVVQQGTLPYRDDLRKLKGMERRTSSRGRCLESESEQ